MPLDPLRPGDPAQVGPHRLLGRLGQGGMGTVYLAVAPDDRAVAVKVLRDGPADVEGRRRFRRELEVLQRVRGPHLVEVLGGDPEAATPWIVTRFVPGRRLDEQVADTGPLDEAALLRVARGVAEGLAALHAAGVVHRDLTPGNVLLVDGEPHVIDLGLAVVADLTAVTRSGLVLGTAGYLAPEQVLGVACGPPADVHAWGATLAQAGTGRPPYGTGRAESVLYRVVHSAPDLAGLPPRIAPLVEWALAKEPASRPRVAELVAALSALAVPAAPRDLAFAGSGPHPRGLPAVDRTDVLDLRGRPEERTDALPLQAASPDRTQVLGPAADRAQVLPPAPDRTRVLGPAADRTRVLGPPSGRADVGGEPVPDAEPPAAGPPSAGPPAVPSPALVVLPALAALGAVALLVPVLTAVLATLVLLAAHTVTGALAERRQRLERRGPRRRDPLVAVLSLPVHALGAAADLALGIPAVLVTAAVPAYLVQLLVGGARGAAAFFAVGTVLGVVTLLSRRRAAPVRSALATRLARTAPRSSDAGLLGAALLVAAVLVGVWALSSGAVSWSPSSGPPQCAAGLPCP